MKHEIRLPNLPVGVLTRFYCNKLEDLATIIPALEGLSCLVKLPNLQSTDVKDILNAYVPDPPHIFMDFNDGPVYSPMSR